MSENNASKTEYVQTALFIYTPTEDSEQLIHAIENNPFGSHITKIPFDRFINDVENFLINVNHVVISVPRDNLKFILKLALQYKFSVGLLPQASQKNLSIALNQYKETDKTIELALRQNSQLMDLILCNDIIVLFNASIGRVPLLDKDRDIGFFEFISKALSSFKGMKFLKFNIVTANNKKISTAASGCMIIQHYKKSLASRLIHHDSSARDGAISLIIISPFSVIEYFKFLIQTWRRSTAHHKLPSAVGYIKSSKLDIESEIELTVSIDGKNETHTPVHCEVIKDAIRINLGEWLEQENDVKISQEYIMTDNIPDEKELQKTVGTSIPFFSYASEQRFRDLFLSLRIDAKISLPFVVLMVLSTALATFGLYLNSAAVIIGAMLLAPLMSPIVSIAMALLRQNKDMFENSAKKIVLGISIALGVSMLIALMFPHKPVTAEMLARLNPTLLDLAVAILSGIAAAYAKSVKEVAQSLAGVAIAVALVPPLAVAGVGLGQGDLWFFMQAFLLFSTNLVGIIFFAALTFRVLGFSSATKIKRGILFVLLSLALITIPLYLSYNQIVNTLLMEAKMTKERFLINGKYIIINKARITYKSDQEIVYMELYTRDTLSRSDLNKLKQKIQSANSKKLIIRTKIIYIL